MKPLLAWFCLSLLALSARADDFYLSLAGIPGESTAARHEGWIRLQSFQEGVDRSSSSSRPAFSQMAFTKFIDRSTSLLLSNAAAQKRISSGTLDAVRRSTTELRYLEVKMTNLLVTSFAQSGSGGDSVMERFSLDFRTIEWTYTQFDASGRAVTNITCSWNRDTGAGVGGAAPEDSDGDGMPDEYERFYNLNPLVNDADADADGDGATNLEEFRAGTNPTRRDSVFRMTGRNLGGQVLLTWTAVPDKTYRLLAAPSPEGPFEFVRFLDPPADGGKGEITVPTTAVRQFFLITVQ